MKLTKCLLSIRNLEKGYQKRPVIVNVNLEIEKGEIYGLIGQNGVGKTTLLRLISGMAMPDSGEIIFHNTSSKGDRCKVGGIVESPAFYADFSGRQNLEYYRILYNIPDKEKIAQLLNVVGLQDNNKKYRNYSLGMKQRLAVALALLNDPDIVLLDEPNNGLDPLGIAQLRDTIIELNQTQGITFIISSHILTELSQVAEKVVVMDQGTIIRQFNMAELNEKANKVLLLKVNDYQKAQQIIRRVAPRMICSYDESQWLRCENCDDVQSILSGLINAGIQIIGVHEQYENSEDIFLSIIGRKS